MMINVVKLPFALLFGFVIGLGYFSFLWLTVRRLPRTRHPVLLMVGSAMARLGLALMGLYLLAWDDWPNLVVALLGFLLARTGLILRWRPQTVEGKTIPGGGNGN